MIPERAELPLVAISQGEFTHGLRSIEVDDFRVKDLQVVPFKAAFEDQDWGFDAFVLSYQVINQEGQPYQDDKGKEAWPRINKSAVAGLRKAGLDVRTVLLIQDWDLPGKADGEVWTDETLGEWLSNFQRHRAAGEFWATRWTVWYTTRAGARFVYVLTRSVPVEEAEPLHRGILHAAWPTIHFDAEQRGGQLYSRCSDWTRLMRLPRVNREGELTHESEFFRFEAQYDERVDPDEIAPVGPPSRTIAYSTLEESRADKPTPDEALRLLVGMNVATGKELQTAWALAAHKMLKGRDSEDVAFKGLDFAPPEGPGRDTAMTRIVGEAAHMLTKVRGTTPEHIYALFREAAEQLLPDNDTPDWTDKLWDLCQRFWDAEVGKARAEEEQEHDNLATLEETMAGIVQGMRTWCDHPSLHAEDATEAATWTSEHLIALATSGLCFVMTKSGAYDPLGVPIPQVASRIRQLDMDALMTLRSPSQDGTRMVDVPTSSLLGQHASHVAQVRGAVEVEGSYIEKIGTPTATLVVPTFSRRKDLVPTFDEEVDRWLQLFAGDDEHYFKLCEWLAWSIAYDEGPECALSVAGQKSIGKNMLVRGCCEALTGDGTPATVADLVGTYQYGLLKTPFLHIDEGLPEFMVRHPADTFREFVGGSPLTINRRYSHPVTFECPTRIILTANSNDVVGKLCGQRDMSAEDREAIGIRLFHLDVTHSSAAAVWLEEKGGRDFTGKPGRRWVRGSAGQPSDFVLAKHIHWLYQNRGTAPGKRLLVEGEANAAIVEEMRTDSAIAQILGKILCEMLKAHDRKRIFRGLTIEQDKVYVLSGEVHQFFTDNLASTTREGVSIKRVSGGLKSLATRQLAATVLLSRPQTGKQRWYEIEPSELYRLIQRHGYDVGSNSTLERLAEGAKVIPFAKPGLQSSAETTGT